MIDAVLLNGTVGAGKTSTASALSDRSAEGGVPHALVDMDWIRILRPPPVGDPFQHRVAVANLGDLADNYRAAGARRLIVAGVVETGDQLDDVRSALRAHLLCVRLTVDPAVVPVRLHRRHEGDPDGLAWHLDRSPRLAGTLEEAGLDDLVVDTTDRAPSETAALVAEAAGW